MKKTYRLHCTHKKLLADTVTPVNIYLKLRDKYPQSFLLESSDYHGIENSFSFICCDPIAHIKLHNNVIEEKYPDGTYRSEQLMASSNVPAIVEAFTKKFQVDSDEFNFFHNGLFGYISYDAVRYFEDIELENTRDSVINIPEIQYHLFRYVIAINHFKDELIILEYLTEKETSAINSGYIEDLIRNKNFPNYPFDIKGNEKSNFNNSDFLNILNEGKTHIQRGDVFQVVLSRNFTQDFTGDEFNVYRALRSINPSPYLFYFDYGDFKLFGSSPEAQLVIKDNRASIHPIAGTFKRTGDDLADAQLAEKLKADEKENAEHIMLVDLARNDLSRNGHNVQVETFREIQYYSHVIHLVSKVTADLNEGTSTMKVVADTFPAGTLSGAPKHKAMQLIDRYENQNRSFYAGCIGFMGFNGDFNHAIMIRSFLSSHNTLYYQAGAGIVTGSVTESELQEVNNKLLALKHAITMAREIGGR